MISLSHSLFSFPTGMPFQLTGARLPGILAIMENVNFVTNSAEGKGKYNILVKFGNTVANFADIAIVALTH